MKYLIITFLLFPFLAFSQSQVQENKTKIQVGEKNMYELVGEQKKGEGLFYLGSGEYQITEIGGSGFVGTSTLKKRANEKIETFTKSNKSIYKITNIQEFKMTVGVLPKVKVNFLVYNEDGLLKITKNEAKKELLELNDLLKNGLINQDEFDKKAIGLKKILLSN